MSRNSSLDRIHQINTYLFYLPQAYARRWCEPGPEGCACLGCANGPEAGAGNLSALGFSKEEWQAWKDWLAKGGYSGE